MARSRSRGGGRQRSRRRTRPASRSRGRRRGCCQRRSPVSTRRRSRRHGVGGAGSGRAAAESGTRRRKTQKARADESGSAEDKDAAVGGSSKRRPRTSGKNKASEAADNASDGAEDGAPPRKRLQKRAKTQVDDSESDGKPAAEVAPKKRIVRRSGKTRIEDGIGDKRGDAVAGGASKKVVHKAAKPKAKARGSDDGSDSESRGSEYSSSSSGSYGSSSSSSDTEAANRRKFAAWKQGAAAWQMMPPGAAMMPGAMPGMMPGMPGGMMSAGMVPGYQHPAAMPGGYPSMAASGYYGYYGQGYGGYMGAIHPAAYGMSSITSTGVASPGPLASAVAAAGGPCGGVSGPACGTASTQLLRTGTSGSTATNLGVAKAAGAQAPTLAVFRPIIVDDAKARNVQGADAKDVKASEADADSAERSVNWRTVLCRHFAQGFCEKGSLCSFSHDPNSATEETGKASGTGEGGAWVFTKATPTVKAPASQDPPTNAKTVLCRHFERGHCGNGDNCTFAHGPEQLRPLPLPANAKTSLCNNFASGDCRMGTNCSFAHGIAELRGLPQSLPRSMSHVPKAFVAPYSKGINAVTAGIPGILTPGILPPAGGKAAGVRGGKAVMLADLPIIRLPAKAPLPMVGSHFDPGRSSAKVPKVPTVTVTTNLVEAVMPSGKVPGVMPTTSFVEAVPPGPKGATPKAGLPPEKAAVQTAVSNKASAQQPDGSNSKATMPQPAAEGPAELGLVDSVIASLMPQVLTSPGVKAPANCTVPMNCS
eukprot:TRINITY_DN10616_c0_g1_i4.p1 TRINITY_DN10616_c0_g1~~TRINITY_DN10616_c0_g1_i4.p1  ORF type:complete len:801 (-),score=132.30 TRINITY_DN10616_c0_g1_i4:86-2374(-)